MFGPVSRWPERESVASGAIQPHTAVTKKAPDIVLFSYFEHFNLFRRLYKTPLSIGQVIFHVLYSPIFKGRYYLTPNAKLDFARNLG
jgi:hypothetical protein